MTGTVDLTDLDMWARGVPYAEEPAARERADTLVASALLIAQQAAPVCEP